MDNAGDKLIDLRGVFISQFICDAYSSFLNENYFITSDDVFT